MDRIFKRPKSPATPLLGCWQLMRSDDGSTECAEVDFRPDGHLLYSVRTGDRWQIMKLVYKVEGDVLITDQPSSPRKERTRFALRENGNLMLEFGGRRSWYKRGAKEAPEA